jgi:pyruvate,orthophosphate dikinase
MSKYVYFFANGKADGRADMKNFLGGKGANLAEMTNLGVPVPPGFTISAEVCDLYYKNNRQYPEGLWEEVDAHVKKLEKATGKQFGGNENPLLVSVRSGAAISMPGMMDTVLNLGLNEETLEALIKKTGNDRFAWDSYRRFIQMFGDVVMGVSHDLFEEALGEIKNKYGAKQDTDLNTEHLQELVVKYKEIYKRETGEDFPTDPKEQLKKAIDAVFGSWNNPRAIKYRQINEIKGLLGTAVNVQTMVFGNMGENSATGVCFTRDPSTGENNFYGEYLINAQGEDVVAGIRTPQPINDYTREKTKVNLPTLEEKMPEVYKQLYEIRNKLEDHYRDMQDMEFTIEEGHLYLLQTRTGKRTAKAAVKIAVDMVGEGRIDKETAILRVNPNQLDQLLHPTFDPNAEKKLLSKGLPASPGAATGKVVFTADEAEAWAEKGEEVILVRIETSPEDIGGMNVSNGILTSRGGMTSHAAVVARGMGKCCVAGCGDLNIDYAKKQFTAGDTVVKEGDYISLDGSTGEVILGKLATIDPQLSGEFGTLMEWADAFRRLQVRTNADTPHDSTVARNFGAQGIGLCRTEHMFFEGDRIKAVREMILADNEADRRKALAKIKPMQKEDFIGIFKAMEGLPVTVRLLDPPLHEFLPHKDEEIKELAQEVGKDFNEVKARVNSLKEFNPMLGHRGCRLGITYPEIYEMQVEAIMEAAAELHNQGVKVYPEIMIPLVGEVKELAYLKGKVVAICDKIITDTKANGLKYMVGTMIEIPRAALTADDIAKEAEFFSFGTNDLTQMTFGYSRDDAGVFLGDYLNKDILEKDPFQVLDQRGVGQLVEMGIRKGRSTRENLKVGICGEHGGEPTSVEFCHRVGMNYVSCSPYRVPIARLAAAHAAVKEKQAKKNLGKNETAYEKEKEA